MPRRQQEPSKNSRQACISGGVQILISPLLIVWMYREGSGLMRKTAADQEYILISIHLNFPYVCDKMAD